MGSDSADLRFEEKISFLERDMEHLREEITEVTRRLEALEHRVAQIHRRLEKPPEMP
jgi:prefoldin subunit 5